MASASKTATVCAHHGGGFAPSPKLVSAVANTRSVGSSESDDRRDSKVAVDSVVRPVDSMPDTAKKPANKGIDQNL